MIKLLHFLTFPTYYLHVFIKNPRPFQFFAAFSFSVEQFFALRKKLTKNYLSCRKELFKISKLKKN
jgi:hypothetical protein